MHSRSSGTLAEELTRWSDISPRTLTAYAHTYQSSSVELLLGLGTSNVLHPRFVHCDEQGRIGSARRQQVSIQLRARGMLPDGMTKHIEYLVPWYTTESHLEHDMARRFPETRAPVATTKERAIHRARELRPALGGYRGGRTERVELSRYACGARRRRATRIVEGAHSFQIWATWYCPQPRDDCADVLRRHYVRDSDRGIALNRAR